MTTFARFIEEHLDVVVEEFEAFARTIGEVTEHLSSRDLRDHAKVMLQAFALDMATSQSPASQHEKAAGLASEFSFSQVRLTARQHAQHRFEQGFSLPQMVSEYRALRAAIIRRWVSQVKGASAEELEELTRFGEAVDEGLTEAIGWYSKRLEDSRSLLMGVLAHDLRAPLTAVKMSAHYLLRDNSLPEGALRSASRIVSSTTRMAAYVSDLLDFTRMLLGAGLPLAREPLNLASLCEDVVDEVRAAHPKSTVHLEIGDAPNGSWDASRLSQLLSNLIVNAIVHGEADQPVNVTLSQANDMATIAVHNTGAPISPDNLPTLFQPLMQQGTPHRRSRGSSGLGLGLYISKQIALAHGGTLQVVSEEALGTTFTAHLPPG
jgi:signal transduction histidine kinase